MSDQLIEGEPPRPARDDCATFQVQITEVLDASYSEGGGLGQLIGVGGLIILLATASFAITAVFGVFGGLPYRLFWLLGGALGGFLWGVAFGRKRCLDIVESVLRDEGMDANSK